jgi:hypothetical protein
MLTYISGYHKSTCTIKSEITSFMNWISLSCYYRCTFSMVPKSWPLRKHLKGEREKKGNRPSINSSRVDKHCTAWSLVIWYSREQHIHTTRYQGHGVKHQRANGEIRLEPLSMNHIGALCGVESEHPIWSPSQASQTLDVWVIPSYSVKHLPSQHIWL